jgi:hypothetical protein
VLTGGYPIKQSAESSSPRSIARLFAFAQLIGALTMPISDDADPETLIARLAGPLLPVDRAAFRAAAERALAQLPCQGEGSVYRALASLQRAYFRPPSDAKASWDVSLEMRGSQVYDAPPIEFGGDLRHVRYRKLRVVG